MTAAGGLHTRWALELMRGLRDAGAGWVVVSPGSRSTPLALAAVEVFGASSTVVVDERSAAFVALGFARVAGAPAVMIVTSGSAGAHAFPAVIEAELACVPLIVLTADRPMELFDAGAPQTIDQHQLFGRHVRAAFEVGAPDESALPVLARVAFRAVRSSLGPEPGPVHINARFRKPLEPIDEAAVSTAPPPVPDLFLGEHAPSDRALAYVRAALSEAERPIIALGPLPFGGASRAGLERDLSAALGSLIRATHLAVVAEVSGGVRVAVNEGVFALGVLAEANALSAELAPDLILELGSPPVSSAYASIAARARRRIVVSPRRAPDPHNSATAFIEADPARFARDLASMVPQSEAARAYTARLRAVAVRCEGVIERELSAADTATLGEPLVMRRVVAALPEHAVVMVGNSLAVRDLDVYAANGITQTVLHQRGASGIDGLIAGAVGARLATPAEVPVVLLLGDVSAAHDVGSIALLRDVTSTLVVVVINNGGGRIFDALPVKQALADDKTFERLFLTPQPAFLEGTAAAFGASFARAASCQELGAALEQALGSSQATLIEVSTPHQIGKQQRAKIRAALRGEVTRAD